MYSERVTEDTIEDFARQNGWRPEPHTPEQCDEFAAYVDSVLDVNSNSRGRSFWWKDGKRPTDTRIKQIRRWIENEQFMSFASAEYFITRYGRIRDAEERIIHFQFRLAQRILLNAMAECDDEQKAIQLFVLKARQLGISTAVAQFFLHRILFRPNTYAVMASVQAQQSDKLAAMADLTWSRLPFWLPPAKTILKVKEPKWANGSALSVQSGTQEVGIAQGTSPSCLVPSTLIRIRNGDLRRVDELKEGDTVFTHNGISCSVKRAWKTIDGGRESRILQLWGTTEPLEVTRDHLISTPGGWVESERLNVGDYVTHPVRRITHTELIYTVSHRKAGQAPIENIDIPLNYDWGYMAGFYLAEGHVKEKENANETVFTVHEREVQPRMNSIEKAMGKRWSATQRKHTGKGVMISVSCSWLARWLRSNFGRTTDKHVPDWAFSAGRDFCEGILRGWLDGDGHLERTNNNVVGVSICSRIIFQMRDIIASLGLGWSSTYFKPAHIQAGMEKRPSWWLILSGPTGARYREMCGHPRRPTVTKDGRSRHWRYSTANNFIEIKIKSVEIGWNKDYWDVEVDDPDHSFTTEHCSVHNCIHISEIGDYANPKKVLEEGLFPACHPTRSLFMVLEGTGSTATIWQKEKWEYYSANVGKGGKFTPFFIPPACAGDLYPHSDWLRANPIPQNWSSSDATRRMRRRGELFVRSTDYLWKVLGQRWEMDQAFQWYWECLYKEAVASHSEKKFLAQYAPTPEDAFQSDNDPVFRSETIEVVTKQRELGYKAYAITGRTVLMGNENEPYYPRQEDIDPFESRIQLHWEANDGNNYDYELVPLKAFDDSRDENCFDKLLIFEAPKVGAEYICAIDTAYGLNTPNEDRSTLSIHKHGHGQTSDIQVAAFTSLRVNAPQMARIAAAVALLYGTDGDGNVTSSNPLMMRFIIEQVRKPGDECQHQLKIMGFIDHHIMHYYDQKGNIDPNKGSKEGWRTTAWSRSILLERFVDAINTGWLIIHDPIGIRQLSDFERKQEDRGKSRMEHSLGAHDDNLFAEAMAWTGLHDTENTSLRIASRYAPTKKEIKYEDAWCVRTVLMGD